MNNATERYNHPNGYNNIRKACDKFGVKEIPLAHEVYINKSGNKCWRDTPAYSKPLVRLNNGRVIPWNGKPRHTQNDTNNFWDDMIYA
jgi:hypothetical protein